MSIYVTVSRDRQDLVMPLLEFLPDALEAISRAVATSPRKQEINNHLQTALLALRDKVVGIDNSEVRNRELLKLAEADLVLGSVSRSLETFSLLGNARNRYVGDMAQLLYRSGYIQEAVRFALSEIRDNNSASQAVLLLAQVSPSH